MGWNIAFAMQTACADEVKLVQVKGATQYNNHLCYVKHVTMKSGLQDSSPLQAEIHFTCCSPIASVHESSRRAVSAVVL